MKDLKKFMQHADVHVVVGERTPEARSVTRTAGKMNALMMTVVLAGLGVAGVGPVTAQTIAQRSNQNQAYQEPAYQDANVISARVIGVRNIRVANNGDPRAIVQEADRNARYQVGSSAAVGGLIGAVAGAFAPHHAYRGRGYSGYKQRQNMAIGGMLGAAIGLGVGEARARDNVRYAQQQANESFGRLQPDDYVTTLRVAIPVTDQYGTRTQVVQLTTSYTPVRTGDSIDLVQGPDGRFSIYNAQRPYDTPARGRRNGY